MNRFELRPAVPLLTIVLFFLLVIGPSILAAPITLLIGWWPSMIRLSKA